MKIRMKLVRDRMGDYKYPSARLHVKYGINPEKDYFLDEGEVLEVDKLVGNHFMRVFPEFVEEAPIEEVAPVEEVKADEPVAVKAKPKKRTKRTK